MMEFVNGKDDIPYMKWKIKAMFQTTNKIKLNETALDFSAETFSFFQDWIALDGFDVTI